MFASTVRLVCVTAHDAAEAATDVLLAVRKSRLKNRAPRHRYVHQLRRKLACRASIPFHQLAVLSFADLQDGASLADVRRPYEELLARLDAEAVRVARIPRDVEVALHRAEERANHALNDVQILHMERPDCPDVLADMEDKGTQQITATVNLVAYSRRKRITLANGRSA